MNIKQIAAGVLLVSATVFTSCATGEDGKIESNVSDAVKNDDVKVTVKDRKVILSGEVKDPAEKARAEAEARRIEGVQTVDNEIVVVLPPGAPTPSEVADEVSENVSDAADLKLSREVEAAIIPFPDVKASVSNRVVTLSGSITRPGHALLIPKIKSFLPEDIKDNLTIK